MASGGPALNRVTVPRQPSNSTSSLPVVELRDAVTEGGGRQLLDDAGRAAGELARP